MDRLKFDARTIRRNMDRGIVTPEEYNAYLASLQDVAENAEEFEPLMDETPQPEESEGQDPSEGDGEVAEAELGAEQ